MKIRDSLPQFTTTRGSIVYSNTNWSPPKRAGIMKRGWFIGKRILRRFPFRITRVNHDAPCYYCGR